MSSVEHREQRSNDKLRVVCLLTRFSTGGAELNALMLASAFRALGYDAELWALYRAGNLDTREVPFRIIASSEPRKLLSVSNVLLRLSGAVREFDPAAIIGFQPLANILGALTQKGRGRFIASQRNPSQSQRPSIRALEAIIGSTNLYRHNVAVSEAVKETYSSYPFSYQKKIKVIHNGLPALVDKDESLVQARIALGIPLKAKVVGTIGRLHYQKNIPFLVGLLDIIPDIHLAIAGDGPDLDSLKRLSSKHANRVHFLGQLSGLDLSRAYRSLDIFLFPSLFEGFGRSLIEAMSLSVPIIANDLPITREVSGGHVCLAPLIPEQWAHHINRLLKGESYDLQAAKSHAEKFDLKAMVLGYEALIR